MVNLDKSTQDIKQGTYRVYLQNPADNSYIGSKEQQLETALRQNDCQSAGRIANDILDRSYEYYVANWKSRAETKCKKFVDTEWRTRYASRRAAAEQKAKATAAKKGGSGSGPKGGKASQAAPRKDDAAESPAADSSD